MSIRIERLTGPAIKLALPDIARLRIEVFREWPYIYDGSYAYERDYIARFAESQGALVVAALDGSRIVGAATATHAGGHAEGFAKPFIEHSYDLEKIYYFGESVLLPAYRGRGLGHAFFDEREAHARRSGTFTQTAFCSVVRPALHPLKPAGYVPLDAFWRKRGYEPVPGMVGSFSWQDIGETQETAKPMQYWLRAL
jgi:GNAT superfamily N-acetyltransferase